MIEYLIQSAASSAVWFVAGSLSMWVYLQGRDHHSHHSHRKDSRDHT